MKLTLIGLPYSGKSTFGKMLAQTYDETFIDGDTELDMHATQLGFEDRVDMLEEEGDDFYVTQERNTILDIFEKHASFIFAPGGSIVYLPEAIHFAARKGQVLYLKTPFDIILERQTKDPNKSTRGIIDLKENTIETLLQERIELYETYRKNSISYIHTVSMTGNISKDKETVLNYVKTRKLYK
ncbi:MAG: shikimate kinase [Candidatus Woesearchaeota archaeon]